MFKEKRILVLVGVIVLMLILGKVLVKSKAKKNGQMNLQTIILKKKDIVNGISTSGVVVSDEKVNVYTNVTAPIKEVLVSVGDKVKKGDILAVLDTSGLENELKQSKLSHRGSIESLNESKNEYKNNIINTNIGLEASKIALSQQELRTKNIEEELIKLELEKDFDSKTIDLNINELKLIVSNKKDILNKTLNELIKQKLTMKEFDDSNFKEEDIDKRNNLKRKKSELLDLERELERERKKQIIFEDYTSKNLVEDARRNYNKKIDEITNGESLYNVLNNEYNNILSNVNALEEEKIKSLGKVQEQLRNIELLKSELPDLSLNITRAEENFKNAENEFYRNNKDSKMLNLREIEKNYQRVKYEVEDLERESYNLGNKLNKAKENQLKISLEEYNKLLSNIKDMEYEITIATNNLEKILVEKQKAIENHIKNNNNELKASKLNFSDSEKQLKSSENNVENSKNALKQAAEKKISNVASEINKLGIERLESQIENGNIIATSNGVVTEVKAEVGAISNDILFVIEDMENIHIKAKVKEYNLDLISLGQKTNITTVASGDESFGGVINYISPRATSQSASPSVDFEISAKPTSINSKIKLGMNAFLNIIIESKKDVFIVPLNAIVKEDAKNYIYNGRNEKILVELGISTKSEVEIKSNILKEGLVIRTDMNELNTGEIINEGK